MKTKFQKFMVDDVPDFFIKLCNLTLLYLQKYLIRTIQPRDLVYNGSIMLTLNIVSKTGLEGEKGSNLTEIIPTVPTSVFRIGKYSFR